MIWRGLLPSVFMIQISWLPERLEWKAINPPPVGFLVGVARGSGRVGEGLGVGERAGGLAAFWVSMTSAVWAAWV